MSCFKTSAAGFKALLKRKGLIDEYLNILDLGRFRSEVTQWTNYANSQYGVSERLFFDEQNGTKAVPNQRAFQIIDWKKGVRYPENDWVNEDLIAEPIKEESLIKEGVDFVYEQHPELNSIGTKEEYSQYLDTIFPDSKVKDIVYHGTTDEKFYIYDSKEGEYVFKLDKLNKNTHFGTIQSAKDRIKTKRFNADSYIIEKANDLIIPVILNSNPKRVEDQGDSNINWNKQIEDAKDNNYNSLVYSNIKEDKGKDSYVVFEPEQIHILGSQEDIKKFKEWNNSNLLYQQREYSPNQITTEVKEQLLGFLKAVNPDFRVEVIDNLSVNGLASASEFLILLRRGKENLALAEEVSHIWLELLNDKKLKKELLDDVVRTKMYAWVLEEYKDVYGNDFEKMKREAAAKLISLYIQDKKAFEYWSGSEQLNKNLGGLITRLINWIKKHFKSPYSIAATRILKGSTDGIDTALAKESQVYYQLDPRYSELETLDIKDITKFDKIFINLNNTLLDYKGYKAPDFPLEDRTIVGKNVKRLFFSDSKLAGELDRYYRDAKLTKFGRELKDKISQVNPSRIVVFTDAPITDSLITRLENEFGPVNLVRTGYNIQETLFDEFGNPVDRIVSGSEKEAYIRTVVLDNPRSNILFVDNQSSPLKNENIPNLSLINYNNDRATYTDVQTKINQETLSERNKEFSQGVIDELSKMDKENLVQLARQAMNMVKNHLSKVEEGKGFDELSAIFKDEYGNLNVPLGKDAYLMQRLLEDVDTFEQGLLNFVNTIESTRLFFKSANDNNYQALKDLLEDQTDESNDKALREIATLMRMILSWQQWVKEIQPYINDTKVVNGVIGKLRQELEKANTTLNGIAIEVLSRTLSDQWKDFNLGKLKLKEKGLITEEQYQEAIYTPQKMADWLYGKYGDARSDSSTFENPLMQSEPIIQAISKRIELSIMGEEMKNLERIVPFQQKLWDLGTKLGMSDEEIGKRITVIEDENYWEDGVIKQRPTTYLLNEWQNTWVRKAKEVELQKIKQEWIDAKNAGLPFEELELKYKNAKEQFNLWLDINWFDEVTPEGKAIYKFFGIDDDIMDLAKERQSEIYEQMREQTNILQRFWISEEMEQNTNKELERLVRELRLLRNEYKENGELKEGEELLIAQKLKQKSLIDRQIYDYELDKTKFLNAIKEQIVGISDESVRTILLSYLDLNNLSALYNFAKDNAPQVFVDWLDRNTRVRYSDNFYEKRGQIIERIKELNNSENSEIIDKVWKELTNLTSFLRDKDLTFDASDSSPVIQQKVKDYELALESLKGGEASPELIELIQQLSEIQSKRYSDYYADVMYDKLRDYLPISSTTNFLTLINSGEFKQWYRTAPQEFKDWYERNHYQKNVWDEYTQSKQPMWVPTYIWMKTEPSSSEDILVVPGWKYNTRILKDVAEVEFEGKKETVRLKTAKLDWITWNPVERVWLPKSNEFKNPNYVKLRESKDEKDKLLFEYLQTVTQFHLSTQDRESGVGRDSVLGFKIPYFNVKYTEGNALKTAWKSATDTLNPREEGEGAVDEQKKKSIWKRVLAFSGIESPEQKEKVIRTDYLGNQFKTIYTPYTTYLKPEETTKNLPLSLANYAAGVEKVKALKNDLPQLNLLEQIFEQFLPKQKGTKNQYGEMVDASTNNRLRLLRHIMDTKLFSNFKDFELGRDIDRLLVGVRKTAVIGSQSDLNIPNAFKNFLQGQLMNWLFIEDGGWGTRKTFYKAAASTKTSYANYLYELGKKNKSIDYHLISWFNPLLEKRTQDFSREGRDNELQDRLGYFSSTASEFSVASTLLYAHLWNQDVIINGEKKKIYDAFTVKNGVLAVKPNVTVNDVPLTLEYLQDLKLRYKMMLESVQGKQWNQTIAQRFTVWQSIEFFKKFFITMFRRRFFFKRDNIVLGEMEGMYITTFKWMVRLFQGFLDGTNYNQAMTPAEKRNLIAARDEMLLAIATLFIISYLFGFDDDDKDKYKKLKEQTWLENMALLIAINTKRETDGLVPLPFISIQNSIYPPVLNETYNFITSPFVGFTIVQEGRKMLDSLLLLAVGDDKAYYDRDMPAYMIEEGDSKFVHYLQKVVQLDNFLYQASPEKKIQVIIQSQNR